MHKIRLYIAGKVDPNSSFGTSHWRDAVCRELAAKTGLQITHLDPTAESSLEINQNDPLLIVGRNSHLQQAADIILVYLSDDISVGGSQEMLIAKYLKKPLIGLAPRGGKFNQKERKLFGRIWENYKDPYVAVSCDKVAETLDEVADYLKDYVAGLTGGVKNMDAIREAMDYYEQNFRDQDDALNAP